MSPKTYRAFILQDAEDTRCLTCSEFGALERLRAHAVWGRGVPREHLKRLLRRWDIKPRVWAAIEHYFTLKEGRYFPVQPARVPSRTQEPDSGIFKDKGNPKLTPEQDSPRR